MHGGRLPMIPHRACRGESELVSRHHSCSIDLRTHDGAEQLHRALDNSELITVPLGGHVANDPVTIDAQIRAAEALKELV